VFVVDLDLDDWLPNPQVRVRRRRSAHADPERLWHAAETIRVCDAPTLGPLVRWRIPGTPRDLLFRDLFRRYPFTVLSEGDGWSASGLAGRLWTLQRDYPNLANADQFREWNGPGTVRVVIANWVESDGDGRATLVSESRIQPVDPKASMRLRALWMFLGRFERLIGSEPLRIAARRAERAR
jgi:hypothetical protein